MERVLWINITLNFKSTLTEQLVFYCGTKIYWFLQTQCYFFCSTRWKNLRGKGKFLQRKVGNVWKGRSLRNKRSGKSWHHLTKTASACPAVLLLYVNMIEVSWQRFSQHHPEHHVKLLSTDNFVEVLLMWWPNLIDGACWIPTEELLLGPWTKSITCH